MTDTQATTDHEQIRLWAEARNGQPARKITRGRPRNGNGLCIAFTGSPTKDTVESMAWESWFQLFDKHNLAFVYDNTPNSKLSNLVTRPSLSPTRDAGRTMRATPRKSSQQPHIKPNGPGKPTKTARASTPAKPNSGSRAQGRATTPARPVASPSSRMGSAKPSSPVREGAAPRGGRKTAGATSRPAQPRAGTTAVSRRAAAKRSAATKRGAQGARRRTAKPTKAR